MMIKYNNLSNWHMKLIAANYLLNVLSSLLTDNGLKINVAKTEHLSTVDNPLPVKLNGEELKNVDHFKYLGSVIDKDGTINRRGPSRAGCMVKLEKIDRSIIWPEDSPQPQSKGIWGHNQTGSDVWERMLGDEGDQQEEDSYHGDEDASRDPRSVETRSHAKRRNPTHTTRFTDRRGDARWPSSLVWASPETRCRQRHPQSDGAGNTRYQTMRTPQEDMAPTDQGRHDGRGCYPRCGPRPEGVEKEDKADPSNIGKRPSRWATWAIAANYYMAWNAWKKDSIRVFLEDGASYFFGGPVSF